jgi:hypothetical protein
VLGDGVHHQERVVAAGERTFDLAPLDGTHGEGDGGKP